MKRVILTDIEGTTSSIRFVKDVLFPYARRALPGFVREHGRDPEVRRWLDAAAADCSDDDRVALLERWIDEDRKHTALKALQGMIWRAGYETGEYTAHIYRDAAVKLAEWRAAGHPLYVYSSGSVAAQRLFFAHTEAGDLSGMFSGFFDTETGGKREVESYRAIARAVERAPAAVLFLSDVVEELDAARDAGLGTVLVDRMDDHPGPRIHEATHGHTRVTSFAEVDPG